MSCPDDNMLLAFAMGSLAAEQREAVAEHIDRCEDCTIVVAEGARQTLAGEQPSTAVGRPPSAPEDVRLGRYVLLEPLGAGGLGQVVAAYDPDLDRRVALKLVKIEADEPRAREQQQRRMLQEARALARLSNPHVVAVHDVGIERGQVYIAMELIQGTTLRAWLAGPPRRWAEVRDAMLQAGQGLAAAHEAGLVHRDFKPDNVLMGEDGRVQVVDFGLAIPVAGDELAAHAGEGTAAYMAPEQQEGRPADARADQYAFCVTLHEVLFGVHPFEHGGPRARREHALAERLVDPIRGRGVPPWLYDVIRRGLRADPELRFDSMSSLLHAMLRDRRSRRRQWGFGISGAVLSGLIAWGVSGALHDRADQAQLVALEGLVQRARSAAERARFLHPPVGEPGAATAYLALRELEALGEEGHAGAAEQAVALRHEFAQMLTRLGDRYWALPGGRGFAGDYYAAALIFDPDQDRARERVLLTRGQLAQLQADAERGEFSSAELAAVEALVALAPADPQQRRDRVRALLSGPHAPGVTGRAQLRELLGPGAMDEPQRDAVVAAAPGPEPRPVSPTTEPLEAPPSPSPTTPAGAGRADAKSLVSQGRALVAQGDLRGAEVRFQRALKLDRHNRRALRGLHELAFQRGAYRDAVPYAEHLVELSGAVAADHTRLGDAYFKVLRYADAERAYRQAERRGATNVGPRLAKLRARLGE